MKLYHKAYVTATGKVFDGPGRVLAITVMNDGVGAGVFEVKDAAAGNTLMNIHTVADDTVHIFWGEDASYPVDKGNEFRVTTLTNATAIVIYED